MDPRAALLRSSLGSVHFVFNMVVEPLDQDAAAYRVGTVPPAMASLPHVLLGEDTIIHKHVRGGELVMTEGGFAEKIGITELSESLSPEWLAGTYDIDAIRAYAAALFAKTDEFLSHATAEQMDQLMPSPMGNEITAAEFIASFVIGHYGLHLGEVAALVGSQGGQGLPF